MRLSLLGIILISGLSFILSGCVKNVAGIYRNDSTKVKCLAYTKVRPEPSLEKSPIAMLRGGSELERMDVQGKWSKIRFENSNGDTIIGWITNSAIETGTVAHNQNRGRVKPKLHKVMQERLSPM